MFVYSLECILELQASKENEDWTIFEQQASLEVKSFWGFEHMVEKLAVKHYSANVKKGEEIIEFHIQELAQEGITYVAPFEETPQQQQQQRDKAKNGLINGGGEKANNANGSLHSSVERHCAKALQDAEDTTNEGQLVPKTALAHTETSNSAFNIISLPNPAS